MALTGEKQTKQTTIRYVDGSIETTEKHTSYKISLLLFVLFCFVCFFQSRFKWAIASREIGTFGQLDALEAFV